MQPPSSIDPTLNPVEPRDETFFLSALQHIRKQPLGRALHWYGWPSCPLTETDYFIFSLSNQLFVVLLIDIDGSVAMKGNHEGLIALAEKALPKAIIDNCQGALRTLETLLINTQQKQHLSLRSSNLMRKPNPNINKLLIKNSNNRLDVQLKILEHDAGHFTFIVS